MGNGVFATRDFQKGEPIETCPVIPIPEKLRLSNKDNEVLDYLEYWFFEWNEDKKGDAMVLGYGMIYNHSDSPNANYKVDLKNNTVSFFANQPIPSGSEIFIDYRFAKQEYLEMIDPNTQEDILVKASK